MTKWCPRCLASHPIEDFPPNKARYDGRAGYCRPCQLAANAEYEQRLRLMALELLGNECARCKITDLRVLCIDHVNGGGSKDRRTRFAGPPLYRRVLGGESGFQTLCHNCNHLKRLEEGEHVGDRVYVRSVKSGVTTTLALTETVTM